MAALGFVAAPVLWSSGGAQAEVYDGGVEASHFARFCRHGGDGQFLRREQSLRLQAWRRDDLIAQYCLGSIYRLGDYEGAASRRINRVEAYVWYYLASVNQNVIGASPEAISDFVALRQEALTWRVRLFDGLILDERTDAHRRIGYILASRGPGGLLRLGELYSGYEPLSIVEAQTGGGYRDVEPAAPPPKPRYGIFPLPWMISTKPEPAKPGPLPVYGEGAGADLHLRAGLPRSPTEALLYFYLSERAGHPGAARLVAATRRAIAEEISEREPLRGDALAAELVSIAQARAANWQPAFEVYPQNLGDPSIGATELDDVLLRVELLDVRWLQKSLAALGLYKGPVDNVAGAGTQAAYRDFQASVFARETGTLTPAQKVLLVKTAALAEHRVSQYVLGYMYHNCLGVQPNVFRAKHWFERAAAQRYPYALYALHTYHKDGYGVEPDLRQAESYLAEARREGFGRPGYPALDPVQPSCPYK